MSRPFLSNTRPFNDGRNASIIYRARRNLERDIRDAQSNQPHVQDWLDDSIDEQ